MKYALGIAILSIVLKKIIMNILFSSFFYACSFKKKNQYPLNLHKSGSVILESLKPDQKNFKWWKISESQIPTMCMVLHALALIATTIRDSIFKGLPFPTKRKYILYQDKSSIIYCSIIYML